MVGAAVIFPVGPAILPSSLLRVRRGAGRATETKTNGSGDDFADRLAQIDLEPFLSGDFESFGVETELVQDGGVDVGDVVAILGGVEAEPSVAHMDDAPLIPPPAIQTENPNGWWSRPSATSGSLGYGRTRWPRPPGSRRADPRRLRS